MEFFRIQKDIPFMRYALLLNAISVITFLAAHKPQKIRPQVCFYKKTCLIKHYLTCIAV